MYYDVNYESYLEQRPQNEQRLMDCRDIQEKIVVLKELHPEEQRQVAHHVRSCEACTSRLHDFELILSSLAAIKPASHLAHELLARYAVHLEDPETPDYDGQEMDPRDIKNIENHLGECIACQKTVLTLRHEYQELSTHLERTALAEIDQVEAKTDYVIGFVQKIKLVLGTILNAPIPKLYPAIAGTLAVLTLVVWYGPFLRGDNPYSNLVDLKFEAQHFATRGIEQTHLSDGLAAFNDQRYDDAISILEKFIAAESQKTTSRAFGESVLGMAYLKKAKSELLGRFVKIDTALLDKAIFHLTQAAETTENVRIKENGYWYVANAYLLRDQPDSARESLLKTRSLNGRRTNAAAKLLSHLQ